MNFSRDSSFHKLTKGDSILNLLKRENKLKFSREDSIFSFFNGEKKFSRESSIFSFFNSEKEECSRDVNQLKLSKEDKKFKYENYLPHKDICVTGYDNIVKYKSYYHFVLKGFIQRCDTLVFKDENNNAIYKCNDNKKFVSIADPNKIEIYRMIIHDSIVDIYDNRIGNQLPHIAFKVSDFKTKSATKRFLLKNTMGVRRYKIEFFNLATCKDEVLEFKFSFNKTMYSKIYYGEKDNDGVLICKFRTINHTISWKDIFKIEIAPGVDRLFILMVICAVWNIVRGIEV